MKCCGLTRIVHVSPEFRDILDSLHGARIASHQYDGPIEIFGALVLQNGETIDVLNSDSKIELIWQEYQSQVTEAANE